MNEVVRGRVFLTDEVYNKILILIAEGAWKAGERIPSEKALCEMFHVSRISIRSVLQRLQALGLTYTIQGVGSFVSKPEESKTKNIEGIPSDPSLVDDFTKEDILTFFEFRQAIEFKAIDLFATCAVDSDYAKLLEVIRTVQNCSDDFSVICESDFDFHMTVIESSKNRYLIQAMAERRIDFLRYVEQLNRVVGENSDTWVKAHVDIYQHLVNKRPNEVKRITLEHNAIRKLLLSEKG